MLSRLVLLLFLPLLSLQAALAWLYPDSRQGPDSDTYAGGQVIADPYRWLEDTSSHETQNWISEQNNLSLSFLSSLTERGVLRSRLFSLWNAERISLPQHLGGRYIYQHSNGKDGLSAIYMRERLKGPPRLLLDPARVFERTGSVPTTVIPSPDGRFLLYSTTARGSDWSTYRILNLDTMEDEPDLISGVKFSHVGWTRNGSGFFYSRYPQTPAVPDRTRIFDSLENQRLYFHRLGTSQRSDPLIHEHRSDPQCFVRGRTSADGRFLVVTINRGSSGNNQVLCADLGDPENPQLDAPLMPLVSRWDSLFEFIGNLDDTLFFRSTWGAPRGAVLSITFSQGRFGPWRTVVPEGGDTLEAASLIGGRLVLRLLHLASSRVRLYTPDGLPAGEVPLPEHCTVTGVSGDWASPELLLSYTDFRTPARNVRYDFSKATLEPVLTPEIDFDPDRFVTRQVMYRSKDGTLIPMFITHLKELPLDGNAAVWLYGYGGFNISMKPSFTPAALVWMERGGVFAVPNLRGGGEFGEVWHQAGMLERKQNSIDDYVAAAEWLIANKYGSARRMVAVGESNGGLVVASAVNQHPELFRVALPSVGVLDLLRFHRFTIGYAWSAEYGSSDDPKAFGFLRACSPLHNIREGFPYPAVLVTTGDSDDRVHPCHSFKFTAALQQQVSNRPGDLPVFLRVALRSGHGAGRTTSSLVDEEADKLVFALHFIELGL